MSTQTIPWPATVPQEITEVRPRIADRIADQVPDKITDRRSHDRNKTFDLLRLLFATLVMLAHAVEFTDGNRSREIFCRLTHTDVTFGSLAVDGFFLLSGYLIVQSWASSPRLFSFLEKRVLRILPGYLVAVVLSIAVVGLLAPGEPHWFQQYFHAQHGHYPKSIVQLGSPLTPSAFPGLPYHRVDGSMWTIAYEFRCYLLVALLGMLGAVRRPLVWAAVTAFSLAGALLPALQRLLTWHSYWVYWGEPPSTFRLMSIFFVGGSYFLFRSRIPFKPILAVVAAVLLALSALYPPAFESGIAVFGGYLLFYLAQKRFDLPERVARFPDISYGLYLYGAPVESLWIFYRHGSPWVTFLGCTLIAGAFGWLSWHFVERPMLRLKSRPTAPLPPA